MFPLHLYARVRIVLCINAHETAGAARTRSSLRPLLFGARLFANLGQSLSRERERMSNVVARIEHSEIREQPAPDFTSFNPGYAIGATRARGRRRSRPAERLQHALLRLRRLGIGRVRRLVVERFCQHR